MTDTTIDTTIDTASAIDGYLRFWNLDPGEEQLRLATDLFALEVTYHAPIGVREGAASLVELSAQFAEHLGDVAFRARTEPDIVGDRARLQWEIIRGDESFAEGTDVIVLDDEGRIETVTTFLDRAPEGFDPHAHD